MKGKIFNNLLLFSLFGIALGFFGMLYEGVVLTPKMLDTSTGRMLFWEDFYRIINPVTYYIPIVPLVTLILIVLFFATAKEKVLLKKQLSWAAILQIATLAITLYIVKQINLQGCFDNIARYTDIIPAKVRLVNILGAIRLILGLGALTFAFRAYLQTQTEKN